ncbi:hypothetical protein AB0442_28465 [Kitasatospora sp. NPDC085895]|uniref:hypothetical protein n=1 Tax=Kitasatospora sp. NPDC085895 TaxID=3155057 RepID=UPI00344C6C17
MIVFDTNQVEGAGRLLLHMLKVITDRSEHKPVLPDLVWEEVLAHVERDVEHWNAQIDQARRELQKLYAGWERRERAAERFDPATAVSNRRAELEQVFGKLPMAAELYREGMAREAWRRRPARQKGDFAVGAGMLLSGSRWWRRVQVGRWCTSSATTETSALARSCTRSWRTT